MDPLLFLIFSLLGLLFEFSAVDAKLEQLEVLNVKAWKVYGELTKNYEANLKANVPIVKGSLADAFGIDNRKNNLKDPQEDLNELAQLYGTLNTADIFALNFLKDHCQEKGLLQVSLDPILCQKYPDFLIKQIQNRMDVIISWVFASRGLLQSPPQWLYHVITAGALLKDIDARNRTEYEVKEAISRILTPKDSTDFDNNPNILKNSENSTKSVDYLNIDSQLLN